MNTLDFYERLFNAQWICIALLYNPISDLIQLQAYRFQQAESLSSTCRKLQPKEIHKVFPHKEIFFKDLILYIYLTRTKLSIWFISFWVKARLYHDDVVQWSKGINGSTTEAFSSASRLSFCFLPYVNNENAEQNPQEWD